MRALIAFLAVLLISSLASADSTSALINEQLDKLVKLKIDAPLPQAMQQIGTDTGVPVRATQAVWDLLPWGEQTKITAKIENQTLRGALQAITRKLGLTFELGDEAVEIKPLPALKRLGRRATVEELEVLDFLARTPLDVQPGETSTNVKALLDKIDAKLASGKSTFDIENRAFNDAASPPIGIARNATLLDALEAIPAKTDATWYPWDKSIVVVPKTDQVRHQLTKTLTSRFNGVDVGQVLTELLTRAGVDYTIEPGAIQRVSPESRNIRLILDNVAIQQALESIMGFTGLAYTVTDKGVYVWNPSNTAAAGQREPTVGLVTLDNGIQVVLRESQVPPDMREYLKTKTDKQLERVREMMKEEGFKPSTQPATQPTTAATKKNENL